MPFDAIASWLSLYLPDWFPAQWVTLGIGAVVGLLIGQFLGTMLTAYSGYLAARRQLFDADDVLRKLDAKKHNEHLKQISSFCNTVGAAIIGAAFILPYVKEHAGIANVDLRWVGAGLALPLAGHLALRFIKSE